jgi:TRAP-type C4-dicarboxylate transport system permease small subunit
MEAILTKITDAFYLLCKYLLIFLMVEIAIVISVSICFRYFFSSPIYWAEEVTRYSFVWATFIGAACAYKRRELVCMSMFANMLSPDIRRRLMLTLEIIMTGFLSVATVFGVKMAIVVSPQLAVATQISMSYLYIVVPISCFFMLLCSIANIFAMGKRKQLLPTWGEDW